MLQALGTKRPSRAAKIVTARSYPSPIMGLVTRKSLAAMQPAEAIALDNWFPRPSYIEIRGGYASHATAMTGNGKTLAVYNYQSGTSKMFCLTASGTYDVSSAGAVGASVAARTDGKHRWTMFGTASANYLILCNGVDKPLYYDGTTWVAVDGASSPALTGVTTTDLISVAVFKGRLIFIQKNSLSFWYLAAGSAGGALTEFPLDGEAKRGGYLMAVGTWTVDAGDGVDDRAVFITSEGEAIIYQGTDPSVAANWLKVGTYFLGRPLGRKCLTQYGGDLLVLTESGVFPLSASLQSANIDYKLALSFNIEPTFNDAARSYFSTFGWCAYVFPPQAALIVNVPNAEDGTHYQYVMNTTSKAWCRFTSWAAEDFGVFQGELYFASGTAVYKAWSGQIDGANNIEAYAKQAFNYFGQTGALKHFKLFRPVLAANGPLSFMTDIDVDFETDDIVGVSTYSSASASLWDAALWDAGLWASGLEISKEWTSPAEWAGYCAAGKVKVATNSLQVQWLASDMVFETGDIM